MRLPTPRPARWRTVAILALVLAFDVVALPAQADPTSGIDLSALDKHVRAQDDFYARANNSWLKHARFPADKLYIGPTERLMDLTQSQLQALVMSAQANAGDAESRQLADLYASFMDEASVARLGLTPLAPELEAIDAVSDRAQLGALFARLAKIGVELPLGFYIAQDDRDATRYVPAIAQAGLGLPSRDYYLKGDDAKFRSVRAKYLQYLGKLLALSAAPRDAAATPQAVLALETRIARVQWSPVENRDPVKAYNPVALAELPALAPAFDWPGYLAAAGLAGKTTNVLVRQPSYVRGLDELFAKVPLATWKAYARLRLLDAYAPCLSPAFVDARFAFNGVVLRGTTQNQPRWRRGVRLVDESIGQALGKRYVAQHFSPESKARMQAMVENLLAAFGESLDTLAWMSPATREQARAKLAKLHAKIGYPARWIDYSTLVIERGDLVGNVMRAHRFEDARQLAKLGQPVDRDD